MLIIMSELNQLDIFVGVKAEQSLRDAVRAVVEESGEESSDLELAPVGRKDWIAGRRFGANLTYPQVAKVCREVLTRLIGLDSRQRIRMENIRLYVVPPPVPVFKDPPAELTSAAPEAPVSEEPAAPAETGLGGPTVCPVCGRGVHSYNLQHDTRGKVVGCFICGGEPGR